MYIKKEVAKRYLQLLEMQCKLLTEITEDKEMSDETKEKVKKVCKIIALLPTVMMICQAIIRIPLPTSGIGSYIAFGIMAAVFVVGWIATLVTGPLKVFKKMFKPVGAAWAWGIALFFPVGILIGLFGAIIVLYFVLLAFAFIPFVYTLGN